MKKIAHIFVASLTSVLFFCSCMKGTVGEPGPAGDPGPSGPVGDQGPPGIRLQVAFNTILNTCLTVPTPLALPNFGGTLDDCVCTNPILSTYSDSACSSLNFSVPLPAFYLPTCSINDVFLTARMIDSNADYITLTCS